MSTQVRLGRWQTAREAMNARWHQLALALFMLIVTLHWVEHIAQVVQVYFLDWKRADAGGVLGMWYPWLTRTEALHYGFAIVMLVGLIVLRPGFTGTSRRWWTAAMWIQVWHHFEHLLLLVQAGTGTRLLDSSVPTTLLQLVIPRVELHMFYNALVFVPMVVAMWYHRKPPADEPHTAVCSCTVRHA
ncbi:hypothetical protein [Actinosynnema sp. ALI-1.44]|uniref:hypothetical protein n=1 Tax=Actinosynnema sp. ALI-1.44 TaxID=1933779 RepID=UPI001EDBC4F7|nr:hypothetical protein [Actinosynnema sp. ALI-1.44]